MTRMDLATELHKVSTLLMTAASEIRSKYGLSPNFADEDDKQAYSVLMSALDPSAVIEASKSLRK